MDAYLVDYVRTPIGRFAGALSGVRSDDLAALTISTIVERVGIDPNRIDDVYFGDANQAGEDNRNVARMASLIAGLPVGVPGSTVNRLCGSGMEAIGLGAQGRRRGCSRPRRGRRRRVDESRPEGDVQGSKRVRPLSGGPRLDDRMAFRQPAPEAAIRHR